MCSIKWPCNILVLELDLSETSMDTQDDSDFEAKEEKYMESMQALLSSIMQKGLFKCNRLMDLLLIAFQDFLRHSTMPTREIKN